MDRVAELEVFYNNAVSAKRKAENDYHGLHEEIEAIENNAKASEDKAVKAMNEVARLVSELNNSHESALNADKSRALLARQVGELQIQLENAELSSGKGLKNQIKKLEARIIELEGDLDTEGRTAALVAKQARQAEKKAKEYEAQLEDERKANERSQDAAEKLNTKMKKMRLQLEGFEQEIATWQSKYKKVAHELEESEERSEAAEAALMKARQRARGATPGGVGTRGPSSSASRQRSRLRTPAADD